jgi:hypothetical protein
VARAYLDQLNRNHALQPARAAAVKSALDKADHDKPSHAALDQLDAVAGQLEQDAASATGADATRIRALAAAMKARAGKLRQ